MVLLAEVGDGSVHRVDSPEPISHALPTARDVNAIGGVVLNPVWLLFRESKVNDLVCPSCGVDDMEAGRTRRSRWVAAGHESVVPSIRRDGMSCYRHPAGNRAIVITRLRRSSWICAECSGGQV